MRPLIVPDEGMGIGEVDLCQIEVGIAAAVYHDEALIDMFNTGDVYTNMAQRFFADKLDAEGRACNPATFKQRHGDLRDIVKTCTLGIIYGLTPHGLAPRLGKSEAEAGAMLEEFLSMFPALRSALEDAAHYGILRGYSSTVTGLRRYRGASGPATDWERNWCRNHPVQGSAAAAFKLAGIRLDRLYRPLDAHLIIPMHDAYVFEAPLEVLANVAELTRRVMCESVQELLPALRPRADINIINPSCWNKEGAANELDKWLASM